MPRSSSIARGLVLVAVLAAAVIGSWAATNALQRSVSLVPGLDGCWRLEGTARQTACLSDEFLEGADTASGESRGAQRDEAVISFVRDTERQASQDARLGGVCHPAMHALGRREGARAAAETRVPEFPGGSTQLCTAGYTHGLAEGYLASSPTADVKSVFPKLCHDVQARLGCAHGIGHSLIRAQLGPDAAVSTSASDAVERCEDLPGEAVTSCHDGVYMELAMRTVPAPISVDDFVATCKRAGSAERELACWAYIGMSVATNDVPMASVPAQCARAALPGQFTCIEGHGRDLGVKRVGQCTRGITRAPLQERCIEGAIGLQVGSGHVSAADARAACRTLSPDELRSYCTDAVARYTTGRSLVEDGDDRA